MWRCAGAEDGARNAAGALYGRHRRPLIPSSGSCPLHKAKDNISRPINGLWRRRAVDILVRRPVGLAVPGLFVYMPRDCVVRRSNQPAMGILYVASVLVFIGEISGLSPARAAGMPS